MCCYVPQPSAFCLFSFSFLMFRFEYRCIGIWRNETALKIWGSRSNLYLEINGIFDIKKIYIPDGGNGDVMSWRHRGFTWKPRSSLTKEKTAIKLASGFCIPEPLPVHTVIKRRQVRPLIGFYTEEPRRVPGNQRWFKIVAWWHNVSIPSIRERGLRT